MKTLVVIAMLCTLSGCANMPGVTASKDEAAACEKYTCTVWTPDEIKRLAMEFYSQGYKAAAQNGAKAL